MTTAAAEYEKLMTSLAMNESVTSGIVFGELCLKANGKAFTSLHNDKVVFKLSGYRHQLALSHT